MKPNKLLLCLIPTLICSAAFSQAPEPQWQNTIGGNNGDYLYNSALTSDGGCILAGFSYSDISGDKTEASFGNSDYWVVKVNNTGALEWENTIGGSGYDDLYAVQQTPDGGYILGGRSSSGISGDKTDANWPGGIFGYDYWIVKLNAAGSIEWQKTIGGNDEDILFSVALTADGGYILGGYSLSGISGDKTEACLGGYDYWVVKLSSTGTIEWQNTIGGNNVDYLTAIQQTTDNGYILGGYSISGNSGDKSENSQGVYDFWVVKINSTGTIQWQNTIGGISSEYLRDIQQTTDGGYILGGPSGSIASGDKTEGSFDGGLYKDYWLIKLNSSGGISWQNTIGGNGDDVLTSIDQTTDGGYIIGGQSTTGISGDKTDPSSGNYDYWVLKLTSTGLIDWQNAIGGNSADYLNFVAQTSDAGYMLAGFSYSDISGDKTENSLGSNDYWIVKLQGDCIPSIEICNTLDDNCNGLIDDGIIETITINAGGATTFCQGGSTTLTASYSGTSVQWKRNGTNIVGAISASYTATKTGNYTCQTSSACATATSAGISVTVNKNPVATITAGGPIIFCAGGSVLLSANTAAGISYQWYKDGSVIPGATLINYTATTAGKYKCMVTKTATGCYKNSNMIKVTINCREGENSLSEIDQKIIIYPNPVSNKLIVELNASKATIQILNIAGQIIYTTELNSSIEEIDVSKLLPGVYFITFKTNQRETTQKFIKQ